MGKNFVAKGHSIKISIPAGGCASTTPVLVGADFVGVPDGTFASGATGIVEVHLTGVFKGLPKKSGDTFAVGDKVYWDNNNSYFTSTSSGNLWKGHAYDAAASADTTMCVRIRQ